MSPAGVDPGQWAVVTRMNLKLNVGLVVTALVGFVMVGDAAADTIGVLDWVECQRIETGAGPTYQLAFGGDAYETQCSSNPGPTPPASFSLFFLTNFGVASFLTPKVLLLDAADNLLQTLVFSPTPVDDFRASDPGVAGASKAVLALDVPAGLFDSVSLPSLVRPGDPAPDQMVTGTIEAERTEVVGEPATVALLGTAALGVLWRRRAGRVRR